MKNRWWFLKFENKSTLVVNATFSGAIGLNNQQRAAVKAGEYIDVKDKSINPKTGTFIWTALVSSVGHKKFCLDDEQRYLASTRDESLGSSELSFQLNTDPDLTVPDTRVLPNYSAPKLDVNKKLTYQGSVYGLNDTTIARPELDPLAASSSMPEIPSEDLDRILHNNSLEIDEDAVFNQNNVPREVRK